jgi:hypothetical protein
MKAMYIIIIASKYLSVCYIYIYIFYADTKNIFSFFFLIFFCEGQAVRGLYSHAHGGLAHLDIRDVRLARRRRRRRLPVRTLPARVFGGFELGQREELVQLKHSRRVGRSLGKVG